MVGQVGCGIVVVVIKVHYHWSPLRPPFNVISSSIRNIYYGHNHQFSAHHTTISGSSSSPFEFKNSPTPPGNCEGSLNRPSLARHSLASHNQSGPSRISTSLPHAQELGIICLPPNFHWLITGPAAQPPVSCSMVQNRLIVNTITTNWSPLSSLSSGFVWF